MHIILAWISFSNIIVPLQFAIAYYITTATFFAAIVVPPGLKSESSNTALTITLLNERNEAVYVYWVNYSGTAQYFVRLNSGDKYYLYTYGTQPWIIADANDDSITYFVPYTADLTITIM